MDELRLARTLREVYSPLLGPEQGIDAIHEEASDLQVGDMRRALRRTYDKDTAVDRVLLVVSGVVVGVTTRERVLLEPGTAGSTTAPPLGEGDRATQLGDSTWYHVLTFACGKCDHRVTRVFFDERWIPACGTHGTMELKR